MFAHLKGGVFQPPLDPTTRRFVYGKEEEESSARFLCAAPKKTSSWGDCAEAESSEVENDSNNNTFLNSLADPRQSSEVEIDFLTGDVVGAPPNLVIALRQPRPPKSRDPEHGA